MKEAFVSGTAVGSETLFRRSFHHVVPLSKTSPEQSERIRARGRDRAMTAFGQPIGGSLQQRGR